MKYLLAILSAVTAFFGFKSTKQLNKDNSSADSARQELTKLMSQWVKMRTYIAGCVSTDTLITYNDIDKDLRYIDTKLKKVQHHLNNI